MPTTLTLKNGIELDLLFDGKAFAGIGEVRCGETKLRRGRRPLFIEIRNPYGVELCDYRLIATQQTKRRVKLTFSAKARAGGPMEWQLHECRRAYNTADWAARPKPLKNTELVLILKPKSRRIGNERFTGFSYQYRYQSSDVPIYMILDRGTWEPGARAIGNEVWFRSTFAPSIYKARSTDEYYSTEWYHPGCDNPNIFQFLPLQTDCQGFTMTTGSKGVLLTWPNKVAHVRTLLEKQRGSNEIAHFHEHCDDLGYALKTAPVEVLFAPGKRTPTQNANLHGAMTELVSDTLHREIGFRRERVNTYGQIEEWEDADLDRYRRLGLPKLLDAGMKTIGLANHFENNMNVYGISNMCCTVDYKVAESVGEKKLKRFCDAAKKAGAKVEMWGNTSVATTTLMAAKRNGRKKRLDFLPLRGSIMEALAQAEEPFIKNTFGAHEADHYTPVFACMNLRDPVVQDYWMNAWQDAHDRIGLEGIFLDSSFNLSSDKFHYRFNSGSSRGGVTADQTDQLGNQRPAKRPEGHILSQYLAHLELMAKMQQAGYVYCNEDSGVFGLHRHGPGLEKRLDNLFMWQDHIAGFDPEAVEAAGADPDDVFFQGLAYRVMWMLRWDIRRDRLTFSHDGKARKQKPRKWHYQVWQAYNRVVDTMNQRTILDDGKGVLYRDGRQQALWAFRDFELPLQGERTVHDILREKADRTRTIKARKHRVYRIE